MIITKRICYFLISVLTTVVLLTTLSTPAFAASANHNHVTNTLLSLTADFLIDMGVDESEIVDVLSHGELSDEEQLHILLAYMVELYQHDDYSKQAWHLLQDELPATEHASLIKMILGVFGQAVGEKFLDNKDSDNSGTERQTTNKNKTVINSDDCVSKDKCVKEIYRDANDKVTGSKETCEKYVICSKASLKSDTTTKTHEKTISKPENSKVKPENNKSKQNDDGCSCLNGVPFEGQQEFEPNLPGNCYYVSKFGDVLCSDLVVSPADGHNING
ncbi:MAG: hypothetical protein OXC40_02720 [Proteobacteria bacterium]|nr:hypothetical protein [Pseudomonadota bacterium]